ncbi:MAG: phosphoribosylglycinamide formyltransferase [Flammeovirgaceae bacterium]
MKTPRICILASGSGTNAEAIYHYFHGKDTADVVMVLSNKADAPVLQRMKPLNVIAIPFTRFQFYESDEMITFLKQFGITHIVLAGFLWQVPSSLVQAFLGKIINIHPALLPKFGGKGMYGIRVHQAVKAAGETETGITIHEVNEHYDEGQIIFQAKCPVLPTDTPEQIAAKVQQLEHTHFAREIEKWIGNR